MKITEIVKNRRTTKAFDPARKLSEKTIADLKDILRFTPSSCNLQPWHFIIAASDAAKEHIADSMDGLFSENKQKVLNASHVIIFCAKLEANEAYLITLIDQEEKDGRFRSHESRIKQQILKQNYVKTHDDVKHWFENQTYIALGTCLLGAGALDVDACPIEGFDRNKLDESFNLPQKGLASVVLVALGYRSDKDFNRNLPKSRLSPETIFTEL